MTSNSNVETPTVKNLKSVNAELRQELSKKDAQLEEYEERVKQLLHLLYGKKTEKSKTVIDDEQGVLFDTEPPEEPEEEVSEDDTLEVKTHKRFKKGRKPLPADLPRVEVIIDVTEEEKTCCGTTKNKIGEERTERLRYVPATVEVVVEVRPKYACGICEGTESEGPTVAIAPPPPSILPKSIATPELLAHILVSKFEYALPFYRQEKMFARIGVDMNRTTMCQWTMKIAEACQPLFNALHLEIRSGPLINIDETKVRVLKKPDSSAKNSQMWVCRGGNPSKPTILYFYRLSRESEVAREIIGDFAGAVQTDGYVGYDFLDKVACIDHLGCFAHVRRGFVLVIKAREKNKKDVEKKNKTKIKKIDKKVSNAEKVLKMIKKLYKIERKLRSDKELSPEEFVAKRRKEAGDILDELKEFLDELKKKTPPGGLLGKAVAYALSEWEKLVKYLEHASATPDNNLVENAIRPFVVGRKNWLFFGHERGAQSGALIYSLIETAKANGLEPYRYLKYIFEKLPYATTCGDYKALLPQHLDKNTVNSCP